MGAFGGGLDHGDGVLLRSRSAFARRCTVSGAVLVVIGAVGIARWWTVSLGLLLLVMAGLVAVIVAEEASYDGDDVDAPEPPAEIPSPRTPTEHVVRFRLPASVGGELAQLVGDFNGWSTTATPMQRVGEEFVADVPLRSGCSFRYRYLLADGRWENDWAADRYVANEFGSEDSVVDVPAPDTAADPGRDHGCHD